jgi:CubicO group peptidase (beta-lactamase class C family)
LVVKDGKLVFETYLRSLSDRDHVHHIQSSTKSVRSLVFGIGRDQGWMPAPDTTLCSILQEDCLGLESRKQTITLDHLLTMRSGVDFSNDHFSVEMWVDQPAHPIRHILDKPLYAEPGAVYNYRNADPQLVGYAMQALTGRAEECLARELLFATLGISDTYWDYGAQGESMAAHGLHLRPRDFAKIGQMVLDGGVWNGTRVVSQEWLDLATAVKVTDTGRDQLGYGYYWWTVPESGGFSTWGRGGQFVFVVPSQRLVLVMVSFPDTSTDSMHGRKLGQFVDLTRPLWQSR